MKSKIKIAICYDFDGTLSPGNMQEHSLLPDLNLDTEKFWKEVKEHAKTNNMNEVLAYMYKILEKSRERKHPIKRLTFKKHGNGIELFKGVENYFGIINNYAKNKSIEIEHYIISSGLKEIIEGTEIIKNFKYVFASEFMYDENDVAIWPAVAIDYTAKTQYLFRINKGIFNNWDNEKINKYVPHEERYIPFRRIIYIGDGETDVPAMKMTNYQGGYSIAVYDPTKRKTKNKKSPRELCIDLIKHNRAMFMAPADYREGSELVKIIKAIIDKIFIDNELENYAKKHNKGKESLLSDKS